LHNKRLQPLESDSIPERSGVSMVRYTVGRWWQGLAHVRVRVRACLLCASQRYLVLDRSGKQCFFVGYHPGAPLLAGHTQLCRVSLASDEGATPDIVVLGGERWTILAVTRRLLLSQAMDHLYWCAAIGKALSGDRLCTLKRGNVFGCCIALSC
jgi:hypothetical protein